MARLSNTTGANPAATMARAGKAASARRSSEARVKVRVARVSKLNGRMIRVAGNSFMTSTNTSNAADNRLPRMIGAWTRRSVASGESPRVRAAASMLGVTLSRLASTVLAATARKRTR